MLNLVRSGATSSLPRRRQAAVGSLYLLKIGGRTFPVVVAEIKHRLE